MLEPEPEPQPEPESEPEPEEQQMQEVVEAARKANAAKVVAELIAEGDRGTSSDGDEDGGGSDNDKEVEAPEREQVDKGSGNDDNDEISSHDQSAGIGKLDREGLLELCTMLMAASGNVPSTPAGDVSACSDDATSYVDEAMAELADESGEVSFEEFEDWWSKNEQYGYAASTQQTAGDGSPLSTEDRYAAAQAAIIASLASTDDLGCEEAIAAAVAAAEAAVGPQGSRTSFPDSSATSPSNEPANSAERKDDVAYPKGGGMMRAYLHAGAAGVVAAAAAWVAQSSMMSG